MGKHPYIGNKGAITQIIEHLRKSFPATLDASTLKQLAIAPKNETFLINILRFVGIIDEFGKGTTEATKVFTLHDNGDFQKGLSELVGGAYSKLISLHSNEAWTLNIDGLIIFFREQDKTSEIVGKRQAQTFEVLATLCGYRRPPIINGEPNTAGNKRVVEKKPPKGNTQTRVQPLSAVASQGRSNFGLTVRVEINLPSDGDQETYDRIFKSIRENLLNGG